MTDPITAATLAFDGYAAIQADEYPSDNSELLHVQLSNLQVMLARWQARNFGAPRAELLALGVAEETGELCHAILKRAQNIRGQSDNATHRAAVGDALADIVIYVMQLATVYRLDLGELLEHTATNVMDRDWVKDSAKGGQ